MVKVNPTTLTVLDVPPYDVISVMCNITRPHAVNISNRISWYQVSPSEAVQILNHSGTNTNITYSGLDSSVSSSVLSLHASLAGRWRYICNTSIEVPGDPIISYSQTAVVTVKGIDVCYILL